MYKRRNSTIIALTLMFALIITSLVIITEPVFAAETLTIELKGNNTTSPSSYYSLNLTMPNVKSAAPEGIAGFTLYIKFDSSKFKYVSYTKGSAVSGDINKFAVSVDEEDNNRLIVNFVDSDNRIKSTDVATLKFKTKPNAALNSEATFTLEPQSIDYLDSNYNIVDLKTSLKNKKVKIEKKLSSIANLSSLTLFNPATGNQFKSMEPSFSADTLSYSVTVKNVVEQIEIHADKQDSKASISGLGKKDLKVGVNNFTVKVTAENGTTKTYTIKVTRLEPDPTKKPTDEVRNTPTNKSTPTPGKNTSTPKKTEGNTTYPTMEPSSTPDGTVSPSDDSPSPTLETNVNESPTNTPTSTPKGLENNNDNNDSKTREASGTNISSESSKIIGYILAILLGVAIGFIFGYYVGRNKKFKSRFNFYD